MNRPHKLILSLALAGGTTLAPACALSPPAQTSGAAKSDNGVALTVVGQRCTETVETDLPGVPLLMELGKNDEDRKLLRLLSASTHIGRPIFTSPGVPAERIAALRKAFDTMVRDPAFLEEAKREKFDIEPTTGQAMQDVINEMMSAPEGQKERLRKIIE